MFLSNVFPGVDTFASFLGHEDEVKFVNRVLNFLSFKILPSIFVQHTSLLWQNFETNEVNLQNVNKTLTEEKCILIISIG